MKTIHPGHLEHRFRIFGCQILCITDLAIMPLKRYLYGMALTSKLETVHLIHLDNDVCKIVRVPQPFFHCISLADVQGALLNARPYQQAGADRKRRNRAGEHGRPEPWLLSIVPQSVLQF